MTERHILQNAVGIGFTQDRRLAEAATTFGIFALQQVAPARARAQNFAASGNFKSFGHRFPCFNTFWSSHKLVFPSKRARNIGWPFRGSKWEVWLKKARVYLDTVLNWGLESPQNPRARMSAIRSEFYQFSRVFGITGLSRPVFAETAAETKNASEKAGDRGIYAALTSVVLIFRFEEM